MNSSVRGGEWHARTLRAWQLAMLRFVVTLDNADRLAVMAIAIEIDRLGSEQEGKPNFGFFRRTSAELCAAILQPNDLAAAVLREYLARMDDGRLKRAFAAAIEAARPTASSAAKLPKRDKNLWKGLAPRASQQL